MFQSDFFGTTIFSKHLEKENMVFRAVLILIPFPILARSAVELHVCSYHLNIGQDQLNVALIL